jgi:hypothetical protein
MKKALSGPMAKAIDPLKKGQLCDQAETVPVIIEWKAALLPRTKAGITPPRLMIVLTDLFLKSKKERKAESNKKTTEARTRIILCFLGRNENEIWDQNTPAKYLKQ